MGYLMSFVNTVDELINVDDGGCDSRYLDMFGDTGTAVLGQMSFGVCNQFPNHVPHVVPMSIREEAAEAICNVGKVKWDKAFFSNSGTESVEAMIKFARKATGRQTICVPDNGQFHGRTYGAMSISDTQPNHVDGYAPFMPGVFRFNSTLDIPKDSAAVILTPGLVNKVYSPYSVEWVREIAEHCRRHNILLCFDEVQTFMRLGVVWGHELYGVEPDMVCTAKGVAGGLPCGVTLVPDWIADKLEPGGHFSTFGANLSACHGVKYMCDLASSEIFMKHISNLGNVMSDQFRHCMWARYVEQDGAMAHVELIPGIDTKKLVKRCAEEGVLIQIPLAPALKLTPPLNMTLDDCAIACFIIKACVGEQLCCIL